SPATVRASRAGRLRQRLEQPGARGLPVPLDRRDRDAQDLTGFFERKAAEEPEPGNLTLPEIEGGEPRQCRIEVQDVDVSRRLPSRRLVQRDARPSARPFTPPAGARVTHEDAPPH